MAQLAQHLPCKQALIGSNPVLGAKEYSSIVQWIRTGDYGSSDRGSNPFGTTEWAIGREARLGTANPTTQVQILYRLQKKVTL